jgi:HSP20 family protein
MKEEAMEKRKDAEGGKSIVPACSIAEDSGVVAVKIEMPGVPKEGLAVRIEGNSLYVEGRRSSDAPRGTFLVKERRRGDYAKIFTLDETIDREKVEAEFCDGILNLRLHIKDAAKPRRIAIA